MVTSIAAPPATIISALSTDKATTSRAFPEVAVAERTAQR
jgi:hypothetical protein